MKKRVLLLTPYFYTNRGNATTAKRLATGLRQYGCEVKVFAYEEDEWNEDINDYMEQCDFLHIIHFYRFFKWMNKQQWTINKPYIMTNGGTDVNLDIFDAKKRKEMATLLQNAKVITVFTEDGKQKLQEAYKEFSLRIEIIEQSVWFPPLQTPCADLCLPQGKPTILLPSGLRDVKDVFFLLDELLLLQRKYSSLQFVIAGLVLDENIYKRLQKYMETYDWIHFMENVPINQMVCLYEWADIVLNTSISEGQSSALLEAMQENCLVMARNNPGNESIIQDGKTGYLFQTGEQFLDKIEEAFQHPEKTHEIMRQAKKYVEHHHSFEQEIKTYVNLYNKLSAS